MSRGDASVREPAAVLGDVLVVVDVQRDFCEGGSLAVEGGNACAERIASVIGTYGEAGRPVIYTRDWHPVGLAGHFADAPDYLDTWPAHCVAGTDGAAFHEALPVDAAAFVVSKGVSSAAYSGFEGHVEDGRSLEFVLRDGGARHVDVCGIATSHCVRATVLDALRAGFSVRVLTDVCVGVTDELAASALDDMRAAGAVLAVATAGTP